jgi:iron complex transport system substrate-binding protein
MVTDETGRVVNIPDKPQRIVSLAPGITETLYELGLEKRIVGVTGYCDWPVSARSKPQIGGFTNPSVEKIVSLKPDLIIATIDGNRKDTVMKLERIGLPVYVIDPSDMPKILQGIIHIGDITGQKSSAAALVEKLKARLNNITAQIGGKKKPRVFIQIGLEPLITAGGKTLIHEIISSAGGVNIAGDATARYPRYSAEGIVAASPEIVLFAPMAHDKEFRAVKKFWRKFPQVPAMKNNRIYPVDTDIIGRASPRVFDAMEEMALIFHSDIKISGSKNPSP